MPNRDGTPPKQALIWLRFMGPELDTRSVPIYELGESFIALQHIVQRAYLFRENRLTSNAKLGTRERRETALQLTSHEKGSDLYGFAPLLTEPFVQDILVELAVAAILSIARFATRAFANRGRSPSDIPRRAATDLRDTHPLDIAIYGDVAILVSRIDNIGGVQAIEIGAAEWLGMPPVRLDSDVKSYVAQIKNEPYLGELQTIRGRVTKLYVTSKMVVLHRGLRDDVKVYLNNQTFEQVRQWGNLDSIIAFAGRPIYRFGSETLAVVEFQAYSVESGPGESKST